MGDKQLPSIGCEVESMRVQRLAIAANQEVNDFASVQCPVECTGPEKTIVMKRFALIGPRLPKIVETCPLAIEEINTK